MGADGAAPLTECFVKTGDPVITDGIVRTTASAWITMDREFSPGTDPWEIVIAFNRYQKTGAYQTIVTSNGFQLKTPWDSNNVKIYLAHSTQWDIQDGVNSFSAAVNTKVWFNITYNAGTYIYYRSTDETTYSEINRKTGASTIKASTIQFGSNNSLTDFDLNETYIKINGSVFWKPYM